MPAPPRCLSHWCLRQTTFFLSLFQKNCDIFSSRLPLFCIPLHPPRIFSPGESRCTSDWDLSVVCLLSPPHGPFSFQGTSFSASKRRKSQDAKPSAPAQKSHVCSLSRPLSFEKGGTIPGQGQKKSGNPSAFPQLFPFSEIGSPPVSVTGNDGVLS